MSRKSFVCIVAGFVLLTGGSLVVLIGCSPTMALSAGKMGYKVMKKEGNIRVFVDGQRASQSKLKKALGKAKWHIGEPVNASPTVRFIVREPEEMGRIAFTTISIYPKANGKYSHQAAFTLTPKSTDAACQLKPNTDYNLGTPPSMLRVLDRGRKEVPGVTLKSGLEYMLQLSVTADRSETMRVYFTTK